MHKNHFNWSFSWNSRHYPNHFHCLNHSHFQALSLFVPQVYMHFIYRCLWGFFPQMQKVKTMNSETCLCLIRELKLWENHNFTALRNCFQLLMNNDQSLFLCIYIFLLFQSDQINQLGLRFFGKSSRKSVKASKFSSLYHN